MASATPAAAFLNRYDQERLVGRGAFGDVYSYRLRVAFRDPIGSHHPGTIERIAVKKVRLRYLSFRKYELCPPIFVSNSGETYVNLTLCSIAL